MSSPVGRERDDRGAVAVVAALTVTLLLIPVAAMAADLGLVYATRGELQDAADTAARAGADELAVRQRDDPAPTNAMASARKAAVDAFCAMLPHDAQRDAVCAGTATWAGDGDLANGEVSFYTGAPDATTRTFPADQDTTKASVLRWVTGIRVVTPPRRVTFGLAAAFSSSDHTDLQKTSTAALYTVLPRYGFLPMYLAPNEHGSFCTRGAPRARWGDNHPSCPTSDTDPTDKTVPRGYLVAPRDDPAENTKATTWNSAVGFDRGHLPLPGQNATLKRNYVLSSYSWAEARLGDLASGLFGYDATPAARLRRQTCRGDSSASTGPYLGGLEGARLATFVDLRKGSLDTFRSTVADGQPIPADARGWLSPDVLQCGRLAVVPVLAGVPDPPPPDGMATTALLETYPVASLRLVWLDDRLWDTDRPVATGNCYQRGFYWEHSEYDGLCQSELRVYTGYVLDPRLLPATVDAPEATNTLDHFVGSGMPVTVRLLRDASDPPAT